MNSKQKGKVGEREFASLLRENGFDARRGQQFSGSPDSPDVICPELHWLHFEVKRCERIELRDWIVQAEADSRGKPWVITFRWNNGPWLYAGRVDLLFKFLRGELPPDFTQRREILADGQGADARTAQRSVPTKTISEVSGASPDTAGVTVAAPLACALPENKPEQQNTKAKNV